MDRNLVGWDDGIFPKFFEGAKVTPPFGSRNLQFSFKADYHQADFLLFYFAPFGFLRRQVHDRADLLRNYHEIVPRHTIYMLILLHQSICS